MRNILIGYDGSPCADEAIDDLARAGLGGGEIEARVLSVADAWPDLPGPEYEKLYPKAAERAKLRAQDALAEARILSNQGRDRVARSFPRWRVDAEVTADSPYWGLVKKAHEWRADLLVVGSQGRSAMGRVVFGSVSHNAVLYAGCSVRIGRCREADAQPPAGDAPVRIVIGWDASPDAHAAVRAAAARKWPRDSAARLVSAIDNRLVALIPALEPGSVAVGSAQAIIQDERELLLHRARGAAEELRATGLLVEDPILRDGDAKRVLVEEADAWRADCIFVGARGLSRMERVLLGSVSGAVAARAGCSVEVIRPAPLIGDRGEPPAREL